MSSDPKMLVTGAFRYEVYPSYDFEPIAQQLKESHAKA